jgi:hypothetical protein
MEEAEQRGGTLGHIFTRTALLLSFVKFDFWLIFKNRILKDLKNFSIAIEGTLE